MKKTITLFVVLIAVLLINSCSKEEEADNFGPADSYFPLEVGRFWKYKCVDKQGITSSDITETEYEVSVQVISKVSDVSYNIRVIMDPCNTYDEIIELADNGDIYNNRNEFVMCISKATLNPNEYFSILHYPRLSGSSWMPSGNISITQEDGIVQVKYDNKETYASSTVASQGECDHYFIEKYKHKVGLIYTKYVRLAQLQHYNPADGTYTYAGKYNDLEYTLIETGVGEIINTLPQVWKQKQSVDYDIQLSNATTFTIGDFGYLGCGNKMYFNLSKDFFRYDKGLDSWSPIASLPSDADKREGSVGFSIGSKGYVCGGEKYRSTGNLPLNELWEYDPEKNEWIKRCDFPRKGSVMNGIGFSIGNKGYVGLGFASYTQLNVPFGYMNDFYEYDPVLNSWKKLNDFPGEPRSSAVGFSLNGKGYVGLGYGTGAQFFTDFWEYDPITENWTRLPDFPGEGRTSSIGYGYNNLCYVGMGEPNDLYIFDIRTKTWSSAINQPCLKERSNANSFVIDNKIFYGTNFRNSDLWEYTME